MVVWNQTVIEDAFAKMPMQNRLQAKHMTPMHFRAHLRQHLGITEFDKIGGGDGVKKSRLTHFHSVNIFPLQARFGSLVST